ncbi:MAG: ABC transporter permease subunit [Cyclobacteriaceae bacterium]|nr:ABC transporter permease subunit [Cyclobacteriaceae bacterium]
MNLLITLRAEFLKIKRTSLIYFTILASAFVPVVMLLENLDGTPNGNLERIDPFRTYYAEGWMFIAFLILPMFIVLMSTLLLQIEHRNNTWKQVMASPQQVHTLLASKFLVLQAFIIMMLIMHNVLMLIAAVPINIMYPDFKIFDYLNSWDMILSVNARTYFAALGISGLQFWLALRYRNFIISLGIGIILCTVGPLLVFEFNTESILTRFPFALSILVNIKKFKTISVGIQWLSVGYMIAFLTIAFMEFKGKRVRS